MCPMNWLKKRERFWTTRNKKGMKVMRPELWSFLPLWIGWKKKDKSFFLPSILQKWGKENREGQVIGWAWPSLLVGGESSSNNTWNTCLIRSNFLQLSAHNRWCVDSFLCSSNLSSHPLEHTYEEIKRTGLGIILVWTSLIQIAWYCSSRPRYLVRLPCTQHTLSTRMEMDQWQD